MPYPPARSIPIVVPGGTDPVARGYAESLARPAGNAKAFGLTIPPKLLFTADEFIE